MCLCWVGVCVLGMEVLGGELGLTCCVCVISNIIAAPGDIGTSVGLNGTTWALPFPHQGWAAAPGLITPASSCVKREFPSA